MSRNFYILAATIFFFSLVSFVLMWTNGNPETGSAGDASLWKTIALVLMVAALLAAFAGTLSGMFEQTHRRSRARAEAEQKDANRLGAYRRNKHR